MNLPIPEIMMETTVLPQVLWEHAYVPPILKNCNSTAGTGKWVMVRTTSILSPLTSRLGKQQTKSTGYLPDEIRTIANSWLSDRSKRINLTLTNLHPMIHVSSSHSTVPNLVLRNMMNKRVDITSIVGTCLLAEL